MQLRLSKLFTDFPLAKAWGLSPLGATVVGEIEKPVGCNWPPLLKTSASLLDSPSIGYMTKAIGGQANGNQAR